MTSRIRKAPQPQCSFQVHCHRSAPTGMNLNYSETTKDKSLVGTIDRTLTTTKTTRCRNDTSPTSSMMIDPINSSCYDKDCSVSGSSRSTRTSFSSPIRDISPLKKNTVRRVHSFDDSYTPSSPSKTGNMDIQQQQQPRAGRRKDTFHRSSSLPSAMKKKVTFHDKPDIVVIERMTDILLTTISDDNNERNNVDNVTKISLDLWWTGEEYNNIIKEYESILYLLDQNLSVDEAHESARGLYNRTESGAWEMYEKQRNARNAVLHQQDLCRKKKKNCANTGSDIDIASAIAEVYMKETLHLREHAINEANKDFLIACEYYDTMIDNERLKSLDGSISDLSLLDPTLETKTDPNQNSANSITLTLPQITNAQSRISSFSSRTKDLKQFQDSFQINSNTKFLKGATTTPHRGGSSVKSNANDDTINGSSLVLSSVFGESCQSFLNGELLEEDDEDVDDDDENQSTDNDILDPIPTNSLKEGKSTDHVATRVRFASKTQKIKRLKVKDPEKDLKKRWYSKDELIEMATHVNNVIEMIEAEGTLASNDTVMESKYRETRRGLEKNTEDGARKVYDCRRSASNAVFTLQRQQREESGVIDHAAIATAYLCATKEACEEAIKIGKQDAKDARKHRLKRRSSLDEKTKNNIVDEVRGGRKQSISELFDDEEDQRKSISPPNELSLNSSSIDFDSNNDSFRCSTLNLKTNDEFLIDDGIEGSNNILDNLEKNGCDYVGHDQTFKRSVPKSQSFVQTSAQMFDRQAKMLELKKADMNFKLPGRATSAPKNLFQSLPGNSRINPYDIRTNDDSTNNDESLEEETIQAAHKVGTSIDMFHDKQNTARSSSDAKVASDGDLSASKGNQLSNYFNKSDDDNKNAPETTIWFKVNLSDCEEIISENGEVKYLLKNATKFNRVPSSDK